MNRSRKAAIPYHRSVRHPRPGMRSELGFCQVGKCLSTAEASAAVRGCSASSCRSVDPSPNCVSEDHPDVIVRCTPDIQSPEDVVVGTN